jgi:hypothetical protein
MQSDRLHRGAPQIPPESLNSSGFQRICDLPYYITIWKAYARHFNNSGLEKTTVQCHDTVMRGDCSGVLRHRRGTNLVNLVYPLNVREYGNVIG